MTRDELLQIHTNLCTKAQELMRKKNADYAGRGGTEPFANFTRTEAMGICSTERGMLVRMTDKMSRLSSFMESGEFKVKDESLQDTVLDMINYSVLLYAYLQEKQGDGNRRIFFSWPVTTDDIDNGKIFLQENKNEKEQQKVQPTCTNPNHFVDHNGFTPIDSKSHTYCVRNRNTQ